MTGRRTGRGLAGLDDSLVPQAARRLQAAVAAARAEARHWLPETEALRADPVTAVRNHPQALIAAVLVLVVVVSLGAIATHRPGSPAGAAATQSVVDLGPTAGRAVSAYQRAAAARLARYARAHPATPTYAVVDFHGYLTPGQVAAIAGPRRVVRAYVHVTASGLRTPVHVLDVGSVAELPQEIVRSGQVAAAEAKGYRQLLDVIGQPTSERDKAVQAVYAERVAATEAEAKGLVAACRCVYAVVVQGTGEALRRLAAAPQVRMLDPAPAGSAFADLAIIAVLPEVTAEIPADQGFR